MAMHNLKTPIPKAPNTTRVIAFTTPENYAARVFHLLRLRGWIPLWCPSVSVATTPHTTASLLLHLSNPNPSAAQLKPSLNHFSAIAFTSRTGIAAFSEALDEIENPPLASSGEIFTVCALGKDSELLNEAFANRICENSDRIRVLVPPIATPAGMVEALGWGGGRRVLCPVPAVVDLEEPPVVPDFLRDLAAKGWVPVRVDGYETRWAAAECAAAVVARGEEGEGLDAVVLTSTAEVEGLLKGLREWGWDWGRVKRRWPEMVVAAHGPVTAAGAERLGVGVDLVSSRFDSFGGVVDALALRWEPLER
ncbi:uncharacterized protein LOC130751067 [Actinidia eriantha]|uniref:uncharacterized protein LOC130751067 n=1 Tax=Actinidia eriantha TaxID=165200 RepID=UPI00258C047D|nr:uncharacterized protein LOC130751067 [Actinidia eriantha]